MFRVHVVKSTFWYLIGGILPTLSGFILLYPYTKYLSVDSYGALAIFISLSFIIQIVVSFGIETFVSIHHYNYQDSKTELAKFVSTNFNILLIIGLSAVGLTFLIGEKAFTHLFGGKINFFPYGFLSVITGVLNAIFRCYTTFIIYLKQPVKYFLLNLLNFVLTLSISYPYIVTHPNSLDGPIYGRVLSGVGIAIAALFFLYKDYGFHFDKSKTSGLIKYCMPLLIFGLLSWVLNYINNYILLGLSSKQSVGIFDLAMKCVIIIDFVQNAFTSVISPMIYESWAETSTARTLPKEKQLYNYFNIVSLVTASFLIIAMPVIFNIWVPQKDFHAALGIFPFLCLSFISRGLYNQFSFPVYFYKKNVLFPIILGVTSIIQIGISFLLIPVYGVIGASVSYFVCKYVQVFLLWFFTKKFFSYSIELGKNIIAPVLYTLLILVASVYFKNNSSNPFYIGILVLTPAYIIVQFYKTEFNEFYSFAVHLFRKNILRK